MSPPTRRMNTVDEKYEHHRKLSRVGCDADVSHKVVPLTRETVDARGDGALVGQISGDAAFVLGSGSSNEGGVEDEAVLGGVASSL